MHEARARRLLCRLLMLYPAAFRHVLGDDLVETALDRWRDAGRRSPVLGELGFWSSEGVRFAFDGVLERMRSFPVIVEETRHAWRQVRRAPAYHGMAVLTLALGIGATTTIFTVADAVVFRPLPYADSDALYLVHSRFGAMELSSNSLANVRDLQASVRSMSWLAAAQDRSPALQDDVRDPERVSALDISANYLPGLGAAVQLGRPFQDVDYAIGAAQVAIVSDALWQRRWGRDPNVLGRSIRLDGIEHTLIGVMRATFRDPEPIESGVRTGVWVPAGASAYRHRDDYGFRVLGRLADGVTLDAAREELSVMGARLSAAYPDENRIGEEGLDFVLYALRDMTVGSARPRLLLLLGAVVLLLLLSCANVANLFLARGITRASELAVRSTLGATRARLALQLFSESLLTAALAAVVGGLLAVAGLRAFLSAAPPGIPRLHEVTLDARALAFVVVLSAITAVLFGSVPALRHARHAAANSGTRMTAAPRARRLQSTLVAVEIAISLVLVTGSALLLNSFRHLLRVHPGFDGSDVVVVDVRPPASANSHALELLFYSSLMERARTLPGVEHAALVHSVPGNPGGAWSRVTIDEDATLSAPTQRTTAPASGQNPGDEFVRINPVYGELFETLDMRQLAGRTLDDNPGSGDPLVIVINEAAARRFFPGVDQPIGRRLALGARESGAPFREVVGIVADVRQRGATQDAEPHIYLPYGQRDINRLNLVLETKPGALLPPDVIARVVHAVAPDVPVDRIDMLSARYAATADQARFLTFLLSTFAVLGLLLAFVGTYATASHALSRRTRELGIRIALGARAGTVFRLVLSHAAIIAGLGIAAGLLLTLLLTRFLDGYIYGITARDPVTFAAAAALIGTCAMLASLGPALRAARVDPNDVLRGE